MECQRVVHTQVFVVSQAKTVLWEERGDFVWSREVAAREDVFVDPRVGCEPAVAANKMSHADTLWFQKLVDSFEILVVIVAADVFHHADGNDAVELFAFDILR